MADKTGIEWTDATWNPVVGCSLVSPGCTNCYAMPQAARIVRCAAGAGRPTHYAGTVREVKDKPVWTGKLALAPDRILTQPLRWHAPRRIFVNSMGDLFHEDVPDAWIDRVFAVMALTPQHTFQILTKRAARMRAYVDGAFDRIVEEMMVHTDAGYPCVRETCEALGLPYVQPRSAWDWWPLRNVWLGTSAEDQARADERVPELLATPAAIRFVSAEPLLGPINFEEAWAGENALDSECWGDCAWCNNGHPPLHNCQRGRQSDAEVERGRSGLDWIIVGGESGPGARPMHPDWARSIRDQCAAAGTAFFFKQWGDWLFETQIEDGQHPSDRFFNADGNPVDEKPPFGPATGRLWHWWEPNHHASIRLGKARAGRLLDGVTHDAMPEVRAHG